VATEEIEVSVKNLLGAIADFQERAKQKDPIKASAKKRFVMGMKQVCGVCIRICVSIHSMFLHIDETSLLSIQSDQVTNGVKSGRAKLVLLAPDTEVSDTVDEKVDSLISEAQSREIPVLYCLNRRRLGKAIKSNMKQAAIAVYDPDGAYEHFRKIVHFLSRPADNCSAAPPQSAPSSALKNEDTVDAV
jgi:ribosomal protein L7Ae-like RNA K-turn-binding protein